MIATAGYLARDLRERLPRGVAVEAVMGTLPLAERGQRVLQLAEAPERVLVCTDCLSGGVNLQDDFGTVVHYDLSWNPTLHEQREDRVDRYGQPIGTVRVLSHYGLNDQIEGRYSQARAQASRIAAGSIGPLAVGRPRTGRIDNGSG